MPAAALGAQGPMPVRNTFLHFGGTPDVSPAEGNQQPQPRIRRATTAPAPKCFWGEDDLVLEEGAEAPWIERRLERFTTFDEFDGSPAQRSLGGWSGVADAAKASHLPPVAEMFAPMPMINFTTPCPYGAFIAGFDQAGNMIPAIHCGPLHMEATQLPVVAAAASGPASAAWVQGHLPAAVQQHCGAVGQDGAAGGCPAATADAFAAVAEPCGAGTSVGAGGDSGLWTPAPWGGDRAATGAARASASAPTAPGERTTVMLRNLPNNYTRGILLELLDAEGFQGRYDFVYLPIDFRTHAALGYAFINLVAPADAERLHRQINGFSHWALPSSKVCCVGWSHPHQGLESHIARYRNSPLMHEAVPDEYRPVLMSGGVRVDFPPPTKRVKPPRQGTERMLV